MNTSPITEHEATETSLHHYSSTCERGLRMAHTFKQSLEIDVRKHLEWHAEPARVEIKKRGRSVIGKKRPYTERGR